MAVGFIGGGICSTRRKPPTWHKSLTNFITCGCKSSAPFLAHLAKCLVSFCHHLASGIRPSYVFTFKSSPLKPLNRIKPNLAGMVLGWVPFRIMSDSYALHSEWLLLLKIEISSIVHCYFSISQNKLQF